MEPTEEEEGGTAAHHPERGAVGEKLRKVTVVLRRCDQEDEDEEEQDGKRLGKGKSCQKYGENTLRIVPLMAFVTGFSKPVRQGRLFFPSFVDSL